MRREIDDEASHILGHDVCASGTVLVARVLGCSRHSRVRPKRSSAKPWTLSITAGSTNSSAQWTQTRWKSSGLPLSKRSTKPSKRVGEAKLLESFPGVKSVKALKALDAPRLFAGVIRRKASDPSMKKSLANTQIDVFGHITEGDDTAHVVYRSKMKLGETRHRAVERGHPSQERSDVENGDSGGVRRADEAGRVLASQRSTSQRDG